jgi:cysteinyl-tRNA synthetase
LEGLYFSWRLNYFQRTPSADTKEKETNLKAPQESGLTILNIDYCDTVAMINKSIKLNQARNVIGFAAPNRELNRLPNYPWQIVKENANDITGLKQISNFAVLLNPSRFVKKKYYLDNIQDNNYDLLIIDLSYQGTPLTPADIAFLQKKKNGARRLVFAYMSTGEAESYRSYWQEGWQKEPPPWMDKLNEQWEENYKVKYWTKEWQDILFGSPEAYLDQILAAGFDGVFLDVIDACFYFEEQRAE